MSTTLSTPKGRVQHHTHPPSTRVVRRVGLIDRLALRLGIALVAWSRRPRVLDERDDHARRVQNALDTERREREMLLTLSLMPRRQ